jgi:hypothetical protein
MGAVLPQKNHSGVEIPVAFANKSLNPAQKNYSVTKMECLALVYGVKKFRHYLMGRRFIVETDHYSLQYLQNTRDKPSMMTPMVNGDGQWPCRSMTLLFATGQERKSLTQMGCRDYRLLIAMN